MVTQQREQKITYTTMSVEQAEAFNRAYDQALQTVGSQLGRDYPIFVDNQARTADEPTFEDRSPNDTRLVLGRFQQCGQPEANAAVQAAKKAYEVWSHTPWQERVTVMRRAASLLRERKYEIAAWLTLEAGKPRLEAMGEVEEAADLISTYCDQMEQHDGYVIKLGQLAPEEVNHSVLRPYGVWVVISPFNFPAALTTGMLAGVLTAGNTAVFKPSEETPLTDLKVYECLRDAGLPPGAINYLTGLGNEIGEALSSHPDVEGIAFTGSFKVGSHIYREFSKVRPRPVIAEMGGKNPTIVTRHADLEKAVEGTARGAFGFSGQKCSATSRVYVDRRIAGEFIPRFIARTEELVVGNPTRSDVFMGPVINRGAYERFTESTERARRDGQVLTGGRPLTEGDLQYGYYCAPTICTLPPDHPFFYEELFVPFVAVARVDSLDEALRLSNDSQYGLTAGIFTEDPEEQRTFLDRMEAGVLYVNRKGGSTTGAWPGVQSFGGWKASGSTGKCALGPYYVQQFMREQNQTIVTE
ncbi:MAG: aldehyde dehydrogenase family protein [Chloroflexi bacterium]|nr:aldehyde dehydrogenase family protein [Chloroflexota bacterium]